MLKDIQLAIRSIVRAPAFALAAVITLALGIGANTAVFSVVNAVLLRPMPHVEDPDRLVRVYTSDFSGQPLYRTSSYPDYLDFRDRAKTLSGLAAFAEQSLQFEQGEVAEVIQGQAVSGNYFSLLGLRPALGRPLLADDEEPGRPPVVMISYALWQRTFGADPGVLGRIIRLDGHLVTVVGVAPSGFTGAWQRLAPPAQIWVSIAGWARLEGAEGTRRLEARSSRWLGMIGRLDPNATLQAAQTELTIRGLEIHREYPESWTDARGNARRVTVLDDASARVPPELRSGIVGFATMLMGVVALVLIVSCANVAHLFLARAVRRTREVAVRLALGASRWQLVRQLLTEAMLLSVAGGVLGLVLAKGLASLLVTLRPDTGRPVEIDVQMDARVFAFALLVSVLAALVFGLLPAWQAARLSLFTSLRNAHQQAGVRLMRGRVSLRDLLVVAEVAVSLVLVSSAGLFVRSLQQAATADVGFQRDNVLLARLNLNLAGYTKERGLVLIDQLLRRIEALPGVRTVTVAQRIPLTSSQGRSLMHVAGYTPQRGEDMEFDINRVGPRYFETMQMPLVRGRGFTADDREQSASAVVVNQAFVRRFWGSDDPIGKRVSSDGGKTFAEVVGVVRDSTIRSLGEAQRLQVFVPVLQNYRGDFTLHVRTAGDPLGVLPAVSREIRQLDRMLPIVEPTTLRAATDIALFPQRLASAVLGGFSLVALIMAIVGLGGLLIHSVAARTREIGVRVAIGAQRADVVGLILRRGLSLIGAGVLLGVMASLLVGRLLDRFLVGVSGTDALAIGVAVLILSATGVAATYLPVRQALSVDPMRALRSE
jgi:predicted permease